MIKFFSNCKRFKILKKNIYIYRYLNINLDRTTFLMRPHKKGFYQVWDLPLHRNNLIMLISTNIITKIHCDLPQIKDIIEQNIFLLKFFSSIWCPKTNFLGYKVSFQKQVQVENEFF